MKYVRVEMCICWYWTECQGLYHTKCCYLLHNLRLMRSNTVICQKFCEYLSDEKGCYFCSKQHYLSTEMLLDD
jgi:hypothetical protein